MNVVERLLRGADRSQRQVPWLAFPLAVLKKYGDDQAGNLAALMAYYAFLSIFPILLVFVLLFLVGTARAFSMPSRSSLLSQIVPAPAPTRGLSPVPSLALSTRRGQNSIVA